jgi:regulator of protease activity HflC (stomatin/prohibitin superfamily)
VQAEVLDPGTYYLNPFVKTVVELNLQSQRFEMSGSDAISFLTVDGFGITVEGTLEFNIQREQAAMLTHRVGDIDDILKKLILPGLEHLCFQPQELAVETKEFTGGQPILEAKVLRQKPDAGKRGAVAERSAKRCLPDVVKRPRSILWVVLPAPFGPRK